VLYNTEQIDLCKYRLSKANEYCQNAKSTFELGMFDTAANRSYYAIFHSVRALLALDGKDFKKHSGVISYFQQEYVKSGIFEKNMSDIIKSAFSLRQESDYEDFYVISVDEVKNQIEESQLFYKTINKYIENLLGN